MVEAGPMGVAPIADVVGETRRAADRLRRSPVGVERVAATNHFWSVARMLRASQPPLLLPHRSLPPERRIGYLVDANAPAVIEAIELAHHGAGERTLLFIVGRGSATAKRLPSLNLSAMSEAQATRMIANADLDVLADVGGVALVAMPLVIALRPARAIIEPLCDPFASPAVSERGPVPPAGDAVKNIDDLIRATRDAALSGQPSLQGASALELGAMLEQAVRSHRAGILETALVGYRAVLARYPEHPVALYLLGQLSSAQGLVDDALEHFRHAAAAAPEFRDAHYAMAQRLAERGDWRAAREAYLATVELTPQFAGAWSGLGLATIRLGADDPSLAIEYLQRAVAIEPASAQWLFNLGTACQQAGRFPEARDAYGHALQRDPAHRGARFNLASILQETGDYRGAIEAYERIVRDEPDFAPAYPELGACLQLTGQVDAWLANFQRYRERSASSLAMAVYGLEASMAAGDVDDHLLWRDAILSGAYPAADDEDFVNAWEQLLFLLLHVDVNRSALRECYDRYDAAARALYGAAAAAGPRRAGPIRIGYVSGDLRDHVMGRMIHEWVARHDRSRFAVTLYSLSREHDEWTARFRALDVDFADLSTSSLRDACDRIAADDIDILVDCSGHTRGARPGIFARKPARIQATHIATPGPLGLGTVDYKLTDALSEADDAQRYLIERLMPVPGGVFPWHRYDVGAVVDYGDGARVKVRAGPGRDAFDRDASRRDAADRDISDRDAFVCGAFVSLMKLSPRCLALWRRLLHAVPHAVLAFSPPSAEWRASYLRWVHANGIATNRVTFIDYDRTEAGRLSRYASIDVVLDPLPCGNVNGTMEALAMGVPVITLDGTRHGERLGNALLHRFGITETIAHSEDEYVAIASTLAHDAGAASRLRARIRDLAESSPVWDSAAQVRHVESVYERMLAEHAGTSGWQ